MIFRSKYFICQLTVVDPFFHVAYIAITLLLNLIQISLQRKYHLEQTTRAIVLNARHSGGETCEDLCQTMRYMHIHVWTEHVSRNSAYHNYAHAV